MALGTGNLSMTPVPASAAQPNRWRRWSAAWLGAAALALVNAAIREVALRGRGRRAGSSFRQARLALSAR
jgi:hypothetical protein